MTEILSQFREDELPPSHVDIHRAVRVGRRRRRAQTVTAVAAVAALVGAGTTVAVSSWRNMASAPPAQSTQTAGPTPLVPPPMPTSCTAQRLPAPSRVSPMIAVTAADSTGRFVAGRPLTVGLTDPAVLWDGGTASAIPLAGTAPTIHDINASGVAVGDTDLGDSGTKAFVVEGGSGALLAGQDVTARSISENGTIVGTLFEDPRSVPIAWRPGTPDPERLRLPHGLSSIGPIFIDDDETIVGGMTGSAAVDGTVVVWGADGMPVDLGSQLPTTLPNGDQVGGGVTVVGYHGGWISLRLGDTPVLWNYRTGESRWPIGPGPANAHGWSVGMGSDGPVLDDGQGGLLSLPGLADVIYGPFTITTLASLSDDGRTIAGTISGSGSDGNGDVIPVVWHCT